MGGMGWASWALGKRRSPDGPGVVTSKGTDLGHGLLIDPAVTGSSRVVFTVRGPIFLRLGNPAAVTLTIDGAACWTPAPAATPLAGGATAWIGSGERPPKTFGMPSQMR